MPRKTPARNSKGRFVKGHRSSGGGGRSRRSSTSRSASSVALVRAPAPQIIKVSAPRAISKPRKGGVKRRHTDASGLGGGFLSVLKRRSKQLAGSAGYGWITQSGSETATKIKETMDKLPSIDAIGKPATHGLALLFIATKTGGIVRTVSDSLAMGALHRAAYNFGANGFDLEKSAAVGDDEMSGEIDG